MIGSGSLSVNALFTAGAVVESLSPIVNSADAGDRISNIDLAAANDAICIALCSSGMVAADNDERMKLIRFPDRNLHTVYCL